MGQGKARGLGLRICPSEKKNVCEECGTARDEREGDEEDEEEEDKFSR